MKKYIAILAAVIAVVGGIAVYAYVQSSMEADKQNAEQTDTLDSKDATDIGTPKADKTNDSDTSTKTQPGAYVDYSSKAVADAKGTKLLFFHAPWCPQCQMIDADIKKQGLPDNVTVFKIDYDSNQALRQKYGVTLQTTFVKIDDKGNLIKKFVAYNEPNFDSVKQNLL